MAETLGSLCDKLTIVKLKQYHSEDAEKLTSLAQQEFQLISEIDDFVVASVSGEIPLNKLSFSANKVYKLQAVQIQASRGTIGCLVGKLAEANCLLWHEQEKVYDFQNVAVSEKDLVVKKLASLNLERTHCIDEIDATFINFLKK